MTRGSSTIRFPLLVLLAGAATAQIAVDCNSTSTTDVTFLNNKLGQDPCHVTSFLMGQCTGAVYNISALGSDFVGYGGPVSTDPSQHTMNGCMCSDPLYNLFMACQGACQGKNIIPFTSFTASCNSSFTGSSQTPTLDFPQPVPVNTTIPPWAFIDNRSGSWSQQQAFENVTGATTSSQSSSSRQSSTGSAAGTRTNPTNQPTGSGGGSGGSDSDNDGDGGGGGGGSSHTGAIAGGVVGGVAVIGIVAAGGLYMLRRTRQKEATGDEFSESGAFPHPMHQVTPYASHPGQTISPANTAGSSGMRGSGYGSGYHGSQPGHGSTESSGYAVNPFTGGTPSPHLDNGYRPYNASSRLPEVMSSSGYSSSGHPSATASQAADRPFSPGVGDIYQQDRYDQYPGR